MSCRSSSSRQNELAKLECLRRKVPFVSKTALAAILEECQHAGVPELHDTKSMQQAEEAVLGSFNAYGPLVYATNAIKTDNTPEPVLLVNLLSYLQGLFQQGGSYKELLLKTFREKPCTPEAPWKMIWYTDELTPDNPVGHIQRRKSWAIYTSFLEFGPAALSNERAWLVTNLARTSSVAALSAGISQLIALSLEHTFLNEFEVHKAGLLLKHSEVSIRIFVELGMFLQDGCAHKYVFGVKGDSGVKFCMLCKNSDLRITEACAEDSDEDVVFTYTKRSDMSVSTDKEILDSVQRLASRKESCCSREFKRWEKATGFNHQPHGLLLNERLRKAGVLKPASQWCHDWMHGMASNGCLVKAIFLVCTWLSAAGLNAWSLLQEFIAMWVLPASANMNRLAELFSPAKVAGYKRKKKFVCSASEALALYPIVAYFVMFIPKARGICVPQCDAFLAMCDVVDLLQGVALGIVSPALLLAAVENALELFVAAGWKHYMIKKFHWLLHLADKLREYDGCLPSCWSLERKHRLPKKYAKGIANTSGYEYSMLKQVLCQEIYDLSVAGVFDTAVALQTPHKASFKLCDFVSKTLVECSPEVCLTSASVSLQSTAKCCWRDVVLFKSHGGKPFEAGEIWRHLSVRGQVVSLISVWELQEYNVGMCSASWRSQECPMYIDTKDILCSLTFKRNSDGVVTTLIPYPYR
jgi:hypothetical protein